MKNKRVLVISLILILLVGITSFLLFSHEEEYLEANSSLFAIMLEKDDGTYLESDITSFPSEGYTFNSELSYCVNGSSIEYNDIADKARIDTSGSEKCFMYFTKDVQEVYNFDYTGNYQTFVVPETGEYRIELWGASGAQSLSGGAYTKGDITLTEGETIFVYVGEGNNFVGNGTSFNGGTASAGGLPGGGATDVRLVSGTWDSVTSLRSRIMVAGGSGSGSGNNTTTKGAAGGLNGYNGGGAGAAKGATQISAGAKESTHYTDSGFGFANGGCSGGGGYYGGGAASCVNGGGGGSSYISGHTGSVAITSASSSAPKTGCTTGTSDINCSLHYSGIKFNLTLMIDGTGWRWTTIKALQTRMPTPSGLYYPEGQGHIGNGYAKITLLDNLNDEINYANLENVRYIKDCSNGNYYNSYNHWYEIEAYVNNENVALGKNVIGSTTAISPYEYIKVTDGLFDVHAANKDNNCVTVDLGQSYNLDELIIYNYYTDQRMYYNKTLSVGATNTSGIIPLSNILIDNDSSKIATSGGFKFAQEW